MQATVAKDMKHRGTATQDTAEVVTDKTGTVKDEDEIEMFVDFVVQFRYSPL